MKFHNLLLFSLVAVASSISNSNAQGDPKESRSIPAFTAYLLPNPDGARVSEKEGITRWQDKTQTIQWYGRFEGPGKLKVAVLMSDIAEGAVFQLTIGDLSNAGKQGETIDGKTRVDFGAFDIKKPGFVRLELKAAIEKATTIANVKELLIEGDIAKDAKFNLKERRNAASVHLAFPVPEGTKVAAFYNEVTGIEDPTSTFYMACGWHRGYFGMQVNSPTERRIIFSVWDSGNEAVDRKKVDDVNRVKLIGKGEGVYTGDFGNEGTGGHSHLKYMWKTGEKQRFVVTAKPVEETFTIFSGFWFHPEDKKWMLISSWKAPKEGGYLKGLHGFSENFWGTNGHLVRKARYGNQWIQTSDSKWMELTKATFSHDATGKEDRLDRFMGVEDGEFFLSQGGFLDGFTKFGEPFVRPATGVSPILDLPKVGD